MPGHPIFAAVYNRLTAAGEKAGLAEMRSQLLSRAAGRTLELGAGTGHNLAHYPAAVTELVLTEPDPHMAKRLRHGLAQAPAPAGEAAVIEVGAERLPFEDESFDTVVSTLVLCTVPDPAAVAAEVARVLKPGGQLLFLEHVQGERGSRTAAWQDRLERPWGWFAGGCHPNRDTEALLDASSLRLAEIEHTEMPPVIPALVRPLISGRALAGAG